MATIFKRNGVGRWQIEWFDHTGKRRSKSSGTTDKAAAHRIANRIETEVALRVEQVIDPRIEDIAKLGSLPLRIHLEDYAASMTTKSGEDHIAATRTIIEKIGEEFGFSCLKESTPTR